MIPTELLAKKLEFTEECKIHKETYMCTPMMVLQSGAGYYFGRLTQDKEKFVEPYCRDSEYFDTYEEAVKELDEYLNYEE